MSLETLRNRWCRNGQNGPPRGIRRKFEEEFPEGLPDGRELDSHREQHSVMRKPQERFGSSNGFQAKVKGLAGESQPKRLKTNFF